MLSSVLFCFLMEGLEEGAQMLMLLLLPLPLLFLVAAGWVVGRGV